MMAGVNFISLLPVLALLTLPVPKTAGAPREAVQTLECHDYDGNPVADGVKYIPKKDDPCMACVCDDGFPVMCTAVLCSPPECLLYEAVEGECCRFNCIQPDHAPVNKTKNAMPPNNTKPNEADKANLGLRLIASTVTSFLILALLVFMVHRLRRRRMLIMMRRMHTDQRDEDAVAYTSQFDHVDMDLTFSPYQEPPPPYSPPKPPEIGHGEAPPPYEVNPSLENRIDNREANNNTSLPMSGPRPLQGASAAFSGMPVASSSTGHTSGEGFNPHHPLTPTDDSASLPISRSTREIQAQSEALTSPLGASGCRSRSGTLQTSPSEHEYENLREICARHLMLQRAPSTEAETASAISTPPDFSPDVEYPSTVPPPLSSVAPTPGPMVSSFHSQGAPASSQSQVVVRMHNDNPRSHLVRDGDVMTTSLPAYIGINSQVARDQILEDSQPWIPSYRTQFIKRSDSMEIKCGSNSPRNSFYHEDANTHSPSQQAETPGGATAGSPTGSTGSNITDHDSKVKKKKPLAANLTWNKSCRPFRIRLNSTSPVSSSEEGLSASNWMSAQNGDHSTRHSTYNGTMCITSPSPPSVHQNRHSLPPIDLDLPDPVDAILGATGSKYYQSNMPGDTGMSSDPSPSDEVLEVGHSPTGSGRVSSDTSSQSPTNGAMANKNHNSSAANSSGHDTSSPQSPMGPNMIRSSSIASQVSQFSVCSETGEKKRPRPNLGFPRSIRNDAHYPLSPLSSNYAAPMSSTPPVLKAKRCSPTSSRPSDLSSSTDRPVNNGLGPSPISSPLDIDGELLTDHHTPRNLNDLASADRFRTCRNKISYVDNSPERGKGNSAGSTPSSDSSSGGYPKHPTATSPMTNDSTMSSLSPLSPDTECLDNQHCQTTHTHHPLSTTPKDDHDKELARGRNGQRKVKKQQNQQKKRSSNPTPNGQDPGRPNAATSHSPERLRRLSQNIDSSTTFKQYGFIDDPDVINNARDAATADGNTSLPRNHNLHRQGSHERNPRDHSGDRKREKSRERTGSKERKSSRERRENSRERKKTGQVTRSTSHDKEPTANEEFSRTGSHERRRRSKSRERDSSQQNRHSAVISSPNETVTTDRIVLDNHVDEDNSSNSRTEGKKRERDYTSQNASLERRKKRRSTGDHLFNESSQNNNYPVHLHHSNSYTTNGVSRFPDSSRGYKANDDAPENERTKETDQAPVHRDRRAKSSKTHESRNSMPLIVHRNR